MLNFRALLLVSLVGGMFGCQGEPPKHPQPSHSTVTDMGSDMKSVEPSTDGSVDKEWECSLSFASEGSAGCNTASMTFPPGTIHSGDFGCLKCTLPVDKSTIATITVNEKTASDWEFYFFLSKDDPAMVILR